MNAHSTPEASLDPRVASLLTKRPVAARWLLWLIAMGFLVLLLWAHWAEIDQVTRSPAQVIASARTQTVQAPEGGVLRKLLVKEGDIVTKGQLLGLLERARVQAGVNDSQAKVAALKITLARLSAEVYGRPLSFAPELQPFREYVQNQTALYAQRQRALNEEIAALSQSLKLANEELAMNQPLLALGDVSRSDVLRLQRQASEIQSQITNKRNKYFQDAQAEMTKAQEELKTQVEVLSDRAQLLGNTELLAPTNGIVKNIKINTVGGVLRPGEELLQILPTVGDLLIEAKLKPAEVSFIQIGLPATVKLDAYDYSIFGSLRGTVSYISPDTISEDTKQGELVFYRVQIKFTEREFKGPQAKSIDVRPGLTASVEIKTGQRSVLAYITKPIIKTVAQSLNER
jgi:membrane fusion protein, adhesin transport system